MDKTPKNNVALTNRTFLSGINKLIRKFGGSLVGLPEGSDADRIVDQETYKVGINAVKNSGIASKTYVDSQVSSIPKFKIEVVNELPPISEADSATVYLLIDPESKSGNIYVEYIKVGNVYEELGKQPRLEDYILPVIITKNTQTDHYEMSSTNKEILEHGIGKCVFIFVHDSTTIFYSSSVHTAINTSTVIRVEYDNVNFALGFETGKSGVYNGKPYVWTFDQAFAVKSFYVHFNKYYDDSIASIESNTCTVAVKEYSDEWINFFIEKQHDHEYDYFHKVLNGNAYTFSPIFMSSLSGLDSTEKDAYLTALSTDFVLKGPYKFPALYNNMNCTMGLLIRVSPHIKYYISENNEIKIYHRYYDTIGSMEGTIVYTGTYSSSYASLNNGMIPDVAKSFMSGSRTQIKLSGIRGRFTVISANLNDTENNGYFVALNATYDYDTGKYFTYIMTGQGDDSAQTVSVSNVESSFSSLMARLVMLDSNTRRDGTRGMAYLPASYTTDGSTWSDSWVPADILMHQILADMSLTSSGTYNIQYVKDTSNPANSHITFVPVT